MNLAPETCHAAMEAKDRRFDGRFFTGVTSTGIYCRCICPARTPKPENRRFFPSAAAAESAGFRPCLLCRPELAPGLSPIEAPARLASQALARIEAGALDEQGLEGLAGELGITSRHLRRAMCAHFGASPIEIAQTSRLLAAKRLLADTKMSVTEIAFASGFQSLRRFNAAMLERYGMTPSRMRGRRVHIDLGGVTLWLQARGAYDPSSIFNFLAARALTDIERGDPRSYARTLRMGAARGWVEIRAAKDGVSLTVSEALTPKLRGIIAAVRGAFDLDADIAHIDTHLAREPRLAPDIAKTPGVRIAGSLDPFELAVRAVLGQQVTVAAARTLTERLCANLGETLDDAPEGLSRLFPSAERLAATDPGAIAALGMPRKRAETVVTLARASADRALILARGAIDAGRQGLAAISGIGPWTVEYVSLRGLGDPDAFPAGDSALAAALGSKTDALPDLSPWRGYAAMRLWRAFALNLINSKGAKP